MFLDGLEKSHTVIHCQDPGSYSFFIGINIFHTVAVIAQTSCT